MSISIYDQFVPVFSHLLSALDKVLSKAEADAAARKIDLDVFVNGCLVAQGEVVVVNEKFGIRLTDIISPLERIESLK